MHPLKIQRCMFVVLSKTGYHSVVYQLEDGKELCFNEGYTATKKGKNPQKGHPNLSLKCNMLREKKPLTKCRVLHIIYLMFPNGGTHRGARALEGGMKFWERHVCL